jgi:hypothetical protein
MIQFMPSTPFGKSKLQNARQTTFSFMQGNSDKDSDGSMRLLYYVHILNRMMESLQNKFSLRNTLQLRCDGVDFGNGKV